MKKVLFVLLSLFAALSLVGCTSRINPSINTTKVAYLIEGSLGDGGMYDSGQNGIGRVNSEFGVQTRTFEAGNDQNKFRVGLQAAVNYADILFVIAPDFSDQIKEYADKYPERVIVNLGSIVQNSKKTITSVDFIREQSAYLAGVTAAYATEDHSMHEINEKKIIGVVLDHANQNAEAEIFAFTNGVNSVDAAIKVDEKTIDKADSTFEAEQSALQLFAEGADVVFDVTSTAGAGILKEANERGFYTIVLDPKKDDSDPRRMIAGDVTDYGMVIFRIYQTIHEDTFRPGEVLRFGISQGGSDIKLNSNTAILPKEIQGKVAAVRQAIIDGSVSVRLYSKNIQ